MSDITELTRLMRDLEDQLVVCMRCGMCQSVCPVFEETGREADVARGKLALLDGLMHQMFENPEGVYERLNRCLLCGSCAAGCPSGVSVLEIFMKARIILTGYMGLSPAKKLVLRGLLSRPELFDRVTEWGAKFQKVLTRPVNETAGTSCARIMSPLLGDRHFKRLADRSFHVRRPFLDTPKGNSGLRVAFFVGCLLDKIYPHVAEAVVKVLTHHGVGIWMPDGQACCGIPAVSSGDVKSFHTLVRHNLERFLSRDFDYLVTACATCTSTLREVWPLLADPKDPGMRRRTESLAEKTLDIHAFLVSHCKMVSSGKTPKAPRTRITYHDPCHLKKALKVSAEPRAVIRTNPDYEFIEMAQADTCCGMGGSFNLQYYKISSNIGRRKRDRILDSGASVVATGCPACMMQLSDMLSQPGDRIAVKHPIEVYAESIESA